MFWGKINNERGVSLVLVGLSIIVLFGFGALAIDVAHIYQVKNQLQVAADAAALAGCNELVVGYDPTETNTRVAAFKVALKNTASVADTANNTSYPCGNNCTSPTWTAGSPIPVALNTLQSYSSIQVGHWSGSGTNGLFTPVNASGGGLLINAVRVTARRTGSTTPPQPRVSNWFASIFKLLGANFDFTSIQAVAVAARDKVDMVPIIVNEYWDESGTGSVYGQTYPQSFMRAKNIDDSPSHPSPGLAGKIFAIVGANANSNMTGSGSMDTNGFVDILYRDADHRGSDGKWYRVGTSWDGTCNGTPTCGNLTYLGASGSVRRGDVMGNANGDPDTVFGYVFTGVPDNVVPPTAVREFDSHMGRRQNGAPPTGAIPNLDFSFSSLFRSYTTITYNGPTGNYTNNPSDCPYATIPFFSSSGKKDLNSTYTGGGFSGKFVDKYPGGTKFMVMVYDGTHMYNGGGNSSQDPKNVTVVGYGMIQVDGYASGGGAGGFDGTAASLQPRGTGNTCYGHAIPHHLTSSDVDTTYADISDPYLIQPVYGTPAGSCQFAIQLKRALSKLSDIRLVGPYLKYGVVSHGQ